MCPIADLGFWQEIIGIAFVVAIILILVAGRTDNDANRNRSFARYSGAILVLSLFLMIYSLFGALHAFLDLIVEKPKIAASGGMGDFGDLLNQIPGLGGDQTSSGGSAYATPNALGISNDHNLRYGLENLVIGLASGAVFFYHLIRAKAMFPARGSVSGASGAVVKVTVYGICFIAAITFIAAASRGVYDFFELLFPSTFANATNESIGRQRAVIDVISYAALTFTSVVVFFRAWYWLPRDNK